MDTLLHGFMFGLGLVLAAVFVFLTICAVSFVCWLWRDYAAAAFRRSLDRERPTNANATKGSDQ